jgi:hypothetical protein
VGKKCGALETDLFSSRTGFDLEGVKGSERNVTIIMISNYAKLSYKEISAGYLLFI